MQENEQSLKRLTDLARRADAHCCYTFSEFLDAAQQSDLLCHHGQLAAPFSLEGGYADSERRIAVFGSEELCGYSAVLPIACVKIAPKSGKFADELTHRDFLGSLMALGIRREVLGDILISDGCGYLFCMDTIAPYITANLIQVRRTAVTCDMVDEPPQTERRLETTRVNVASERLDAIISAVWRLSRSDSAALIKARRVFVSSRLCENTSYQLKPDETVSVRGFGRFIYRGMEKETKKGRMFVVADRFV